MASKPPPPSPSHILRTHSAPVNVVSFSDDNERLYSGDAEGTVVVTDTRSLRPIEVWKAHTDGLLGVQEWEEQIITHGRDNKLHVWMRVQEPTTTLGNPAVPLGLQTPHLCYSMDVNALNYCRFSLLSPSGTARADERRVFIALPNLVESSFADIWTLPSRDRLHAAIGKAGQSGGPSLDGRGGDSTGIIMSLHLFDVAHPHISGRKPLRLLSAYEHGGVTCWGYTSDKEMSIEGLGWESLWSVKLHVESVMAMTVSRDNSLALTVSADNLIGRYDIQAAEASSNPQSACTVHRTKHPGNASVDILANGRVCAIGGWDGRVRLYTTKTLKTLGTLNYHKKNCQAVTFAQPHPSRSCEDVVDNDDEMSDGDEAERSRWLAAGGQDHRVSLWTLIDFGGQRR